MEFSPRHEPQVRYLIQGLFVFGLVTTAAGLLHRGSSSHASILIPALWGAGALLPGFRGEFPPPKLGMSQPLFFRGLKLYLWSSVLLFSLYAAAFHAFSIFGFPVPTNSPLTGIPILRVIVYNITAVAFFEELFFRGYLQGRFVDAARHITGSARGAFWFPVISTAFLFAAAHVAVDLDPARMIVFFPGLLFGWLKARSGSLIAPILSHATANVVFEILIRTAA